MARRMRVNLLSGRTAALCLLGMAFLCGSVAGCTVVGLFDAEGCNELVRTVDNYLSALELGTFQVPFLPVLWQVVRVPLAAFLLGLTALGLVGLPLLFAVRGFGLGYAVAMLYRLMGTSGLALGGCLFGVSALFWLPALFGFGVAGLAGSYGLMRRITGDGRYPLCVSTGRYWLHCGLCGCAVLFGFGVECLIVPALVRLIV